MSEVDGIPISRTLPLSISHYGRRGSEAKGKPKTQLLALQKEAVGLGSQDPRTSPTLGGIPANLPHTEVWSWGKTTGLGEKNQCGSWAGF